MDQRYEMNGISFVWDADKGYFRPNRRKAALSQFCQTAIKVVADNTDSKVLVINDLQGLQNVAEVWDKRSAQGNPDATETHP